MIEIVDDAANNRLLGESGAINGAKKGFEMRRRHQTEGQFFAGALALNTVAWIMILVAAVQLVRHLH
jgi:hypothetical protein